MSERTHSRCSDAPVASGSETLTRSATEVGARVVVISPEAEDSREIAVLGALFGGGLERYHVRKPHWSREELLAWLRTFPAKWRSRLVLHQHHDLVAEFGLGGVHFRDDGCSPGPRPAPAGPAEAGYSTAQPDATRCLRSRSCHDLAALRVALGQYDSVFFSPVFPSISKPGHEPRGQRSADELAALLAHRTTAERRTAVLALGGITAETAPRAIALGFDGVAVLGAIWQAAEPVRAFGAINHALRVAADVRRLAGEQSSLVTSAATT